MRGLQLPVCSLDKPFKNNIYSEGNVRNKFFTLKVGKGGKNGNGRVHIQLKTCLVNAQFHSHMEITTTCCCCFVTLYPW